MTSLLCLATVLYLEARGEGVEGMNVVADVVLERVEDPRWPDDVCSVVQQPRQFAWTSSLEIREPAEWATAVSVAMDYLHDDYRMNIRATHFRSDDVSRWGSLEYVGRWRSHTLWREE